MREVLLVVILFTVVLNIWNTSFILVATSVDLQEITNTTLLLMIMSHAGDYSGRAVVRDTLLSHNASNG
jgi:hypothetical protein